MNSRAVCEALVFTMAGTVKIFKLINHEKLTSINLLISTNFCSQPEPQVLVT